jgi:endonuclease/exonuclease/phosphatase family metal-dependent hydrolase
VPAAADGGCAPTTCEAEGVACGTLDDGCGQSLECTGACPSLDGGDTDAGEVDGGDAADGGDGGPVDAGPYDAGCVLETAAAFCLRTAGNQCGPVTGVDNCELPRTTSCGCAFPDSCDAGFCGCTPKSCADLGRECGDAYDECGQYLDCGLCPDGGAPPPHPLRVVAANLSSGNLQSYDPGEGKRILQGLKPDLVMIQEFNYGAKTDADIRSFVNATFGTSYSVYREAGMQIPNGVISRYPIVASGAWHDNAVPNRSFVWARIDIPGPKDLWAVSLHLLTTGAANREAEATQLVSYLSAAVPPADYLVVGGDLNTGSRTEACISTLSAVVQTTGPFPVDQGGNGDTNAGRTKPLDWVMVDSHLKPFEVPVALGANRFDAGLVFDSRDYTPLTDVPPVLFGDSGGPSMQHMAVVRDFSLP